MSEKWNDRIGNNSRWLLFGILGVLLLLNRRFALNIAYILFGIGLMLAGVACIYSWWQSRNQASNDLISPIGGLVLFVVGLWILNNPSSFDGILNVEINDSWWYSDSLTDTLLYFRSFQNMMTDLIDYPDEVHALMAFLRDDQLHMLDQLEREHLLTLNNKGEFIGTGGYGWCGELPGADYDPSAITCKNLWGYCESQASVSISPRMFDEYFLDYQIPILDRFGLSFYGCCEDLDKRLKYIRSKVENLRIVAVSPWSNAESMASQIRGDYVYCWKQNPALIAVEKPDWDAVRKELREVFRITAEYGCRVNVLMRDVRTLAFRPENASEWARIAMEEANLYQARRIHR